MSIKLCATFILMMMSSSLLAAGIYKWVDEQGNVHFTQTPPNLSDSKKVGDTLGESGQFPVTPIGTCTNLQQQLVGDWRGEDNGTRIVFRFYERPIFFSGEQTDKSYFIDYGKQGQLQGGFWTIKGPDIKLKIRKIGNAARKRPTLEQLMVARITSNELVLLAAKEEFRLKRYLGAGNLPACMRKKR